MDRTQEASAKSTRKEGQISQSPTKRSYQRGRSLTDTKKEEHKSHRCRNFHYWGTCNRGESCRSEHAKNNKPSGKTHREGYREAAGKIVPGGTVRSDYNPHDTRAKLVSPKKGNKYTTDGKC
jgi:hypothetical protein